VQTLRFTGILPSILDGGIGIWDGTRSIRLCPEKNYVQILAWSYY